MLTHVKHAGDSKEFIPGNKAYHQNSGRLHLNYVPRRTYYVCGNSSTGTLLKQWRFNQENDQGARFAACAWMRRRPHVHHATLVEVVECADAARRHYVCTLRKSDL